MAYGRLLRNEKVSVQRLIEGVCTTVQEASEGCHVLLVEDTSELNYQAHARRVSGLGKVGNGRDAGLFIHPVLAVDAQQGACLGLAHLHLWSRTQAKAKHYRALPIEAKESHRWIEAAHSAAERVAKARMVTVVADREADIYEMWSRRPGVQAHLLIRACRDRKVQDSQGQERLLFEWMSSLPQQGSYELELPTIANKRSAHRAVLQVRFARVRIARPRNGSDPQAPAWLELSAIEVREDPASVVGREQPVHWRLLTTHDVTGLAQARQCMQWYCQRWHIEQLFRTLKRQGLDIESSLIEDGTRLEKLAVLAASAAVRTLQLTLARDGHSERPASDCFEAHEIEVLQSIGPAQEGKTSKQKNPHVPASLAWAGWIIARLGGWKGYASERKPGPITMLHGLQAFSNILRGWDLAIGRDVCIR